MGLLSYYTQLSRRQKFAVIASIVVLTYAIFGFFIVPSILKPRLISGISEHLGRSADINEIKANPFALSATIKGFELNEADGERFLGFEELYVNFQLSSIFRKAYTFDEIRLTEPDGQVTVMPDGRLNFSDLFADTARPESTENQSNGIPPILIFQLFIEQGRLMFSDLSRPTPFEMQLSPIKITLNNFSTIKDRETPYAFTAVTGDGEMLSWEGRLSVNPLRSQGKFSITNFKKRTLYNYLQDQVRFEVTRGTVNLAAEYKIDASGKDIHFELIDGEFQMADFNLMEKGSPQPLISIPSFSVKHADVNFTDKQAVIDLVRSSDARLVGWLTPDGVFNYQTLFAMDSPEQNGKETSEAEAQSDVKSRPWEFTINELILDNYEVSFEDRTPVEPVQINLKPININLKNLSNRKDSQAELSLNLNANQTGIAQIKGLVGINPVTTDIHLQISQLALKPFQPYVDLIAKVDIVSGAANLKGQINYQDQGPDDPEVRYAGAVSIDSFEADNRLSHDDLLKWRSFSLNGVLFDAGLGRLSIAEVFAKQPYARVIIRPDRTLNLADTFTSQKDEPPDDSDSKKQTPIKITVDTVRIENGSANFADLSLKPNFATGIQSLNGTIKGLSSDSLARADVFIEGKVDTYAPVKLVGQINPLSEDKYTDLELSFKNIELTTFTPYSGKFAGYPIEKGKLSLNLKYKLSKNVLVGENEIFMDQLTLGEHRDGPFVTALPVSLAIALLKDREGKIDINLPVRGDLNDPEFSYGRLVLKAFVNLITKIVTSPFAALGGLLGGDGETLSFVEFEFGSGFIEENAAKKLDKLAAALQERPALRLEIKGASDMQSDRLALAEIALLDQLKKAKLEELRAAGKSLPVQGEAIVLTEDDVARLVIQAYKDKFGKHPKDVLASEAEEANKNKDKTSGADSVILLNHAKQRLIQAISIDETALHQLALKRSQEIRNYLVDKGKIPNERVFMVTVEIIEAFDGDTARVNLTLSGA